MKCSLVESLSRDINIKHTNITSAVNLRPKPTMISAITVSNELSVLLNFVGESFLEASHVLLHINSHPIQLAITFSTRTARVFSGGRRPNQRQY